MKLTEKQLVEKALELIQLQKRIEFTTDLLGLGILKKELRHLTIENLPYYDQLNKYLEELIDE